MALRLDDVKKKSARRKVAEKTEAKVVAQSKAKSLAQNQPQAKSKTLSQLKSQVDAKTTPHTNPQMNDLTQAPTNPKTESKPVFVEKAEHRLEFAETKSNQSRPWSQAGLAKHGKSRNSHVSSDANMADRQPDSEEWLGFTEAPLFWMDMTADARLQVMQEKVADFEARVLSITRKPYRKAMRALAELQVPKGLRQSIEKAHAVAMFIKKLRS